MADVTPVSALPYPELADTPNIETAVKPLAEALDTVVVPQYASESAADLANPTPADGQVRYITAIGFQIRQGAWVPMPGTVVAQFTRAAALSIPNNAYTALTFDTEDLDTLSGHSTVSNPSRYTPTVPGWYLVSGSYALDNAAAGYFRIGVAKNGTLVTGGALTLYVPSVTAVSTGSATPSVAVYLNGSTDYVELHVFQNSGASKNTSTALGHHPRMTVVYSGP